jgi:hypothetical protein
MAAFMGSKTRGMNSWLRKYMTSSPHLHNNEARSKWKGRYGFVVTLAFAVCFQKAFRKFRYLALGYLTHIF